MIERSDTLTLVTSDFSSLWALLGEPAKPANRNDKEA
jgi:hypothetical protein